MSDLSKYSVKSEENFLKKEEETVITLIRELYSSISNNKSEAQIRDEIKQKMRIDFNLAWVRAFGAEVMELNKKSIMDDIGL